MISIKLQKIAEFVKAKPHATIEDVEAEISKCQQRIENDKQWLSALRYIKTHTTKADKCEADKLPPNHFAYRQISKIGGVTILQ